LRLKSFLSANDQYKKNNAEAQSHVQATEAALNNFTDLMIKFKEVMARASNGSNTDNLKTYADQVDQLLGDAVDMANTKLNGRYVFAGTNTMEQPFTIAGDHSSVSANPSGITGSIRHPINEGVDQVVNIDGQEAFQGTAIFDLMIEVRNGLQSGFNPTTAESQSVDTFLDHVATATGKAGTIMQNLDNNDSMLADQQTQLQQLLSVQQDSDIAETTLKMNRDQLNLQAALASGASVLPKTLLDFLK
jgi:flagellar hook-associated protein 3 FlgL